MRAEMVAQTICDGVLDMIHGGGRRVQAWWGTPTDGGRCKRCGRQLDNTAG